MKRIKYLIITFMAFLAVGVIGVSAEDYSTQYQQLTSDGTITVKVRDLNAKDVLISLHINQFSNEQYYFNLDSCNEDYTVCQISGIENSTGVAESHEITITYVEDYSEEFNKLAPNGKITITETALEGDNSLYIRTTIEKFNFYNNTQFQLGECDSDNAKCRVNRMLDETNGYYEERYVEIIYEEKYSEDYQKLTKDGKLTVPYYDVNSLDMALYEYLNKISTDTYRFYGNGCNEDNTVCNIYGADENSYPEHHNVQITYKESYSNTFQAFINNFKVTESTLNQDKNDLILNSINAYNSKNNVQLRMNSCNEDFNICEIVLDTDTITEVHSVNITYKDEYSEGFKKLTKNGKVNITDSSFDSNKFDIIWTYINKYSDMNSSFFVNQNECNDDYTVCTVSLYNEDGTTEQHNVSFTYNEGYGDIFKGLTTDGTIIITSSTVEEEKRYIVDYQVGKFNTDEYRFYVSECNEDYSMCNVVLDKIEIDPEFGYMSTEIERHNVKITYKEEYSEVFKKITSNNKLIVKSIKPTNIYEAEFFLSSYISRYNYGNYHFYAGYCNEDYSVCDIYVDNGYSIIESHKVNISYAEVDKDVLNKVNSLIAALPEGKKFIIEDLELINYLVNTNYDMYSSSIDIENSVINYSSEIKNYFGNMTAKLDARAGWGGYFNSGAFGGFVVLYDNTVYGLLKDGGAEKNHIIYIPDDTENTTEAYIKAAQDRINKYLKNNNVKIIYGGKLSEDFDEEEYKDIVDTSKIRDEYYTLMYGESELTFLIVKDSSKINDNVIYASNDIMTDIAISASSSSVPLDTTIKVNQVNNSDEKYKELTQKLDVKDALIYDLKLYSYTTTEYISKLDDGTFSVSVPVPENLKNKTLAAYYVKDDGTIEEYDIEIIDGKAVFNTNHFSIYTIAEKKYINEQNPNTYDGISTYIVMALISLSGLVIALLNLKSKKIN